MHQKEVELQVNNREANKELIKLTHEQTQLLTSIIDLFNRFY